jgi:hypothetical protein
LTSEPDIRSGGGVGAFAKFPPPFIQLPIYFIAVLKGNSFHFPGKLPLFFIFLFFGHYTKDFI